MGLFGPWTFCYYRRHVIGKSKIQSPNSIVTQILFLLVCFVLNKSITVKYRGGFTLHFDLLYLDFGPQICRKVQSPKSNLDVLRSVAASEFKSRCSARAGGLFIG